MLSAGFFWVSNFFFYLNIFLVGLHLYLIYRYFNPKKRDPAYRPMFLDPTSLKFSRKLDKSKIVGIIMSFLVVFMLTGVLVIGTVLRLKANTFFI